MLAAQLNLLGPFELRDPHGAILADLRGRKARCLLAMLAVSPGRAVGRDWIVGRLWSDRGVAHARGSLRQCLRELRQVGLLADLEALETDRDRVSLEGASVVIDVETIRAAIARHDHAAAADCCLLWRGELLAGLGSVDPQFDEWLYLERAQLQQRFERFLVEAAQGHAKDRPTDLRLIGETLMRIDAGSEVAHRILMREAAMRGDRASALRQFDRLRSYLASELQTRPSAETIQLAEAIRQGTEDRARAPSNLAAQRSGALIDRRGVPSLSIAPFSVLGGPPSTIAEALRDDLSSALGRFRELNVLRHEPADAPTPAPALGSHYALSGTLRQLAEATRLNLQLHELNMMRQVWTTRIDFDPLAASDVWDSVIRRIVASILPAIEADRLQWLGDTPSGTNTAYALYLQAKRLLYMTSFPGSGKEAAELLEQAIALDPGFAPAHQYLVRIYNTDLANSALGVSSTAHRERALSLARRGITIDPHNAEAHFSMGWCHLWRRDWAAASYHFARVSELNPYDPHRMTDIATGYFYLGDLRRAEDLMIAAFATTPAPPDHYHIDLAEIRFVGGEIDEALSLYQRAKLATPYDRGWYAACVGTAGRVERAVEAASRFLEAVASVWAGDPGATSADYVRWFLGRLPLRSADHRLIVLSGLERCGLSCPEHRENFLAGGVVTM